MTEFIFRDFHQIWPDGYKCVKHSRITREQPLNSFILPLYLHLLIHLNIKKRIYDFDDYIFYEGVFASTPHNVENGGKYCVFSRLKRIQNGAA